MTRSAEVKGALGVQWSIYELKNNDFWLPVATAIVSGDANKAEIVTREAMRAAVQTFSKNVARDAPPPAEDKAPQARARRPATRASRA